MTKHEAIEFLQDKQYKLSAFMVRNRAQMTADTIQAIKAEAQNLENWESAICNMTYAQWAVVRNYYGIQRPVAKSAQANIQLSLF